MASWKEGFRRLGLSRVGGRILAGVKPSIRLSGVELGEGAGHRLGGRPNLAPGFDWPSRDGWPLAFVAQLDLGALPATEGIDLPISGAWHFFWGGMEMACGFSPEDRGAWQVVYSEAALAGLPLRDFPVDLDEELRFQGIDVEVAFGEQTFPGSEDQTIEALELTDAEREGYWRFKAAWDASRPAPKKHLRCYPSMCRDERSRAFVDQERTFGIHRVGGFPDYIQHDPKLQAHLVNQGLYCGNETGYNEGKKRGLFPGAAEWELLLQVDSEERAEVLWGGDVGRIHFLIHKDDLRERKFDKTWLVFECH